MRLRVRVRVRVRVRDRIRKRVMSDNDAENIRCWITVPANRGYVSVRVIFEICVKVGMRAQYRIACITVKSRVRVRVRVRVRIRKRVMSDNDAENNRR